MKQENNQFNQINQNNQNNYNNQGNDFMTNNQPEQNSQTVTNSTPPKKINLGLAIGIFTIVIIVVVGVVLFLNNNKKTENIETNHNNVENEEQKEDKSITVSDDINKYWNIDISNFDASLFDGKFLVGGEIIQSKLTGRALNDRGYELRIGNGLFEELMWDEDENAYTDKSNMCYILKNNEEIQDGIHLSNYRGESSLSSDNTEVYYYYNDISKTYKDIIIPECLVSEPNDLVDGTLTIDKIVDKLGAPTYVQGRIRKDIRNGELFEYTYIYNDYTLKFEMSYYKSLGISVTGFKYEGSQAVNQPCEYYDFESEETRSYNNEIEYLKEEQAKYEKSFN